MFAFSKYLLTFALQHLSYRVNHRIYRIRTNASGVFQSCSFYSVKGECCNLRKGHAFLFINKFFTNNATLSRKFDANEAQYFAANASFTKRSISYFFYTERIFLQRVFRIYSNGKTTLFQNFHTKGKNQHYFCRQQEKGIFWQSRNFFTRISKITFRYSSNSLKPIFLAHYSFFPAL